MKLDTLTKLNNKKKMWITPKHPMFFESLEFKTIYSAGIFMQAGLNKTVNTLNNFELERFLIKGLGMSNKEVAGVIKIVREGERIIDDILDILNTKLKKYIFLLDLISVSIRSTPLSDEEIQSINIFKELLKLEDKEEKLLYDFMTYASQLDTDHCIKAFGTMLKLKMPITMSELKYYIPEIEYVTTIPSKLIKPGANLRLVDHCKIMGTIIVPQGTTLHIESAIIHMYGIIIVDGGQLIIRDSQLINESNDNNALILVKNFSEVEIHNTLIDCRFFGGAINQENGNLKIDHSKILNTTKISAIKFWGNQITIENTLFRECFSITNGGAIQVQNGRGLIKSCEFEDCEAKNGGAIFTSDEIMILSCRFDCCKVLQYGSAIYYNGEVKSNILECEYYDCFPEREAVIQYIGGMEEKIISKEYTIKISTILNRPIKITEMGLLNIVDTVIYMNQSIRCLGLLNIKNSKFIAQEIENKDLFILERSRGCKVEASEFDGNINAGIFWAKGSSLHVNKSIFRNTGKGRAIYDAYGPLIKECIFTNCLNGAIITNSGQIINCSFINCREKSGAGVIMYGSRGGVIKDCKFVRCISEFSGGAIDKSSGHNAIKCTYEECKPDNIN